MVIPSSGELITLTVTQTASILSWNATCGASPTADVNGNAATVRQYTCPPVTRGGNTVSQTVSGGTLALQGDALTLNLLVRFVIAGATTGSCNGTLTGTLARQ